MRNIRKQNTIMFYLKTIVTIVKSQNVREMGIWTGKKKVKKMFKEVCFFCVYVVLKKKKKEK